MIQKLRSRKGFSLVEQLVTLLIFVIVAGIVATGTHMATKAYQDSLFESESQVLESTLNLALRDVLEYAYDVEIKDGLVTGFSNMETTEVETANGGPATQKTTYLRYGIIGGNLLLDDSGKHSGELCIKTTASDTELSPLVSTGTYENLRISEFELQYSKEDQIFTVNYTITGRDDLGQEKKCEGLKIRSVKAKYLS